LAASTGLLLIPDEDVDDAVRRLERNRADLLGRVDAQSAPLDHGGATHADARVLRRDDHVAAAEQRRVPGEAAAGHDADERNKAGEARELAEGRHVESGQPKSVGIARASAPTLGEEHYREPPFRGKLEHPILLLVVHLALGAGHDRVIVGDHHAARRSGAEQPRVHGPDAGHDSVRRRHVDELCHAVLAPPGRDRERPVFDEAVRVAELRDVLARGPLARLAPPRHGGRTALVQPDRMALDDLREVRPDRVGIAILAADICIRFNLGRLDEKDRRASHQGLALVRRQRAHCPAGFGSHEVLHLHGFQHSELLARPHEIPLGHGDRHEGRLHGRLDRNGPARRHDLLVHRGRAVVCVRKEREFPPL
jgi:hypothetical protein